MRGWEAFTYVYVLGGMVFLFGLLVAFRAQALRSRRLIWGLVGGFAFFAAFHAYLQSVGDAGKLPPTGAARGTEGIVGSGADLVVVVIYFVVIVGLGAWFARSTKTTSDFFFGGRRFPAWVVAASCVATTVGAYSFVKYSSAGFRFGLSSTMTYLNDWFWMPLWMTVWLPIIYYGRIQSVPEYFERRFGAQARAVATIILLVYLVGYIGINFLTLGKAIHALIGWPIFGSACIAVAATTLYVAAGGQTSVIMTDLLQGAILLAVGLGIFIVGVAHLGGFTTFWGLIPEVHQRGLAALNQPSSFHTMGIFWQDAMANGIAFYFMNQGILMRFMSARSVHDGRKAAALVVLLVMPLAAIAVSGAGWVGRAMVRTGDISADASPDNIFILVSAILATPGVFGLVMAALTAALMSTADTLLTAVAAVFVNDVWRPYLAKRTDDRSDLRVARLVTGCTAVIALLLVPVFNTFDSIYLAHATFVAVITPPMAVALIFGITWKRYHHKAALVTLIGGCLAVGASVIWPDLITPFAQGADAGGEGLKAHKYMRACYGLLVSGALGVLATYLFDANQPATPLLVAGPEEDLKTAFKGLVTKKRSEIRLLLQLHPLEDVQSDGLGSVMDEVPVVLHPQTRARLDAEIGDLLFLTAKGFHVGLRSIHARIVDDEHGRVEPEQIGLSPQVGARLGNGKDLEIWVNLEM